MLISGIGLWSGTHGKRKRHTAEQIIAKLREADVEFAKGQSVGEICRKLAVSEHIYYRWRKEYGCLKIDQANRLKDLERENTRLKNRANLGSCRGGHS